jgi:spore coat polysaccharide biosynthesis protein SpsF
MVDGLQNKKIAFIIQARMQSTRLPGKILMPMPFSKGKPLLAWIIDELKKSRFNSDIIVATSIKEENDVLKSFCNSNSIGCFRGEEEDVLSRFTAIVKQDNFDCIIRLTADNPILDIALLEKIISHHFENNNDYTFTTVLPTGMNFEVISSKALLDIENHSISNADKEHVTLFIRNSGKYKTEVYNPQVKSRLKELRLTVDYASDYALISLILSQSAANGLLGVQLVEDTYARYPWLFETNLTNIQKKQFANLDEEVRAAADLLEQFDFKNVAQILKDKK